MTRAIPDNVLFLFAQADFAVSSRFSFLHVTERRNLKRHSRRVNIKLWYRGHGTGSPSRFPEDRIWVIWACRLKFDFCFLFLICWVGLEYLSKMYFKLGDLMWKLRREMNLQQLEIVGREGGEVTAGKQLITKIKMNLESGIPRACSPSSHHWSPWPVFPIQDLLDSLTQCSSLFGVSHKHNDKTFCCLQRTPESSEVSEEVPHHRWQSQWLILALWLSIRRPKFLNTALHT